MSGRVPVLMTTLWIWKNLLIISGSRYPVVIGSLGLTAQTIFLCLWEFIFLTSKKDLFYVIHVFDFQPAHNRSMLPTDHEGGCAENSSKKRPSLCDIKVTEHLFHKIQ